MNFQYFFFATYPGCFLQVLPFALLTGIVYLIIQHHKRSAMPLSRRVFGALFVSYMTGLVCLVLALDVIGHIWYRLLYPLEDDGFVIRMFVWDCNFVPDLLNKGIICYTVLHKIRRSFNRWIWERTAICCFWQTTAMMYPTGVGQTCSSRFHRKLCRFFMRRPFSQADMAG